MLKFLIPFDGSAPAMRALQHVIRLRHPEAPQPILLLNVREPASSWQVRGMLHEDEIAAVQQAEGDQELQAARDALGAAGLAYEAHVVVGPIAETIATFAEQQGCDQIVMGTHGVSGLAGLLLGSVANKVIHLAAVPVTVVK